MSAMKANKLAKGAHARILSRRRVRFVPRPRAHRFEGSLPEQAIDKGDRRRVIEHEPVIARQRHTEPAQVSLTVA